MILMIDVLYEKISGLEGGWGKRSVPKEIWKSC